MTFDKEHFDKVCIEIQRHLEDSEISKLAHWNAAEVYGRRHMVFIGLPATVFFHRFNLVTFFRFSKHHVFVARIKIYCYKGSSFYWADSFAIEWIGNFFKLQ